MLFVYHNDYKGSLVFIAPANSPIVKKLPAEILLNVSL